MLSVALVSFLIGFSGALIPGPLFAVTLQQALLVGWTAGLWLVIGHALSEVVLVVTLRAGVGNVLTRPRVTRVIGLAGGVVLLYFAWDMAATALNGSLAAAHADAAPAMSYGALIGKGVLLTVANPTWYVWWATVGVGLIAAQAGAHGTRAWPVFFAGHSLADITWYVLVSTLVAVGGRFLSVPLHRALILACAAGVAAIGIFFLVKSVREYARGAVQA